MRILIACEESQAVCIEMRKRGHAGGGHRDPKMRSKTFPGIARAMAEQWTDDLTEVRND